jgi:hypothetical protein
VSSVADKYALLPKDGDFVFDFNKAQFPMANRKTFPALVGTGVALAPGTVQGECPITNLSTFMPPL